MKKADRIAIVRACSIVLACLALLVAAPAAAQRKGPTERKAAEHFRQGRAYFEKGMYAKALAEYERAYELVPRPLILFHMGRAHHQAGAHAKAIDHYRRFVSAKPEGEVADEARGYIAELEQQLEREREAADQRAAAEAKERRERERRAKADTHLAQAKIYRDSGLHARAAAEHEAAHAITGDPELLFETALDYERAGDKDEAIERYARYAADAQNPRSAEARERIKQLAQSSTTGVVESGAEPEPEETAPPTETQPEQVPLELPPAEPVAPADVDRGDRGGVSWLWVGAGVAAAALGIAADLGPDSSSNGKLDATDFIPVGLYGLGAGLVFVGVF